MISLNQFSPNTPVAGLYPYAPNLAQLHNVIASSKLSGGCVVTLDSTSANTSCPVVKQAAVTDPVFGVVVYNPVKNTYQAGDRVAVARANDPIWMVASGAITAGSTLYFNADNQVCSTGTSVIGTALTPAAAAGDLIQVELGGAAVQQGEANE